LNNALKWVKGDLIQFFCQDDIMHEDFIKKQVVDFDANGNVGMVFSAFSEIDDQGNLLKSKCPRPFNPKHNLFISTQEASDYFIKFGCFQGNLSPVMLRKEVFKRSGYFNSELKYAGDFEYWVRLSTDFGMYYRNEIGLEVRHHANRASSILSNHQLLHDLIFIYGVLLNRFSEKERQQRLGWVNKVVGVQFVHHALKQVITLKWPLKSLLLRYKELNSFPFKATKAMSWYLVLLPYRFWMRVYFAFKA
jgi:glycosyltransferase involved in cell wall biosynthesis